MKSVFSKEESAIQEWLPAKFFDKIEQKWVESDTHEITKTGYVRRKNKYGRNRYIFNPATVSFGYKGRSTRFNLAVSIYATFVGPIEPNTRMRRERFTKHINVQKQNARTRIADKIIQTDLACRIINIGDSIQSILKKNKDNNKITYCTIYHAVGSKSHIGGPYRWFYLKDFVDYVHPSYIEHSQEIVEVSKDGTIKKSWSTPESAALDLGIELDTLYKLTNNVILDKHMPFVLDRNTYNYLLNIKAIDISSFVEEEWRSFYHITGSDHIPVLIPEYEVSNLLNVRRYKNNATKMCNKEYIITEKDGVRISMHVRKAAYHVFKRPLEKDEHLYLLPSMPRTIENLISSKVTQLDINGNFIKEWGSPTEIAEAGFLRFPTEKLKEQSSIEPIYYKGYYWIFSECSEVINHDIFGVAENEEWRLVKYFDTKLNRYAESKTTYISNQGRVRTKYATVPKVVKNNTIYITTEDGRPIRLSHSRAIYATFIREPELNERIKVINRNLPISVGNLESSRIVGIDKYGNKVADWLNIAEASLKLKVNETVIQKSVNSGVAFRGATYYLYSYDAYINLQTKDKEGANSEI